MKTSRKIVLLFVVTIILLSGCSLPGLSGPSEKTVTIGTLGTSESKTIGNMIKQMIEHNTDLQVEMVGNLGSSTVQHKAMMSGDIDITATRYTGTDIVGALNMDPITDPEKALKTVKREFDQRFNQTWFDSYGFANSYAFTVTSQLAKNKHLETVSDLEKYASDLRLGVDSAWIERKGVGYDAFVKEYGFEFNRVYPMQLGLVYQAVANGKMDVVLAYTTDGRIEDFNLVTLKDNKHFFPPYDASPVARNEVLKKHPELRDILNQLAGKISTKTMRKLNYKADVKLKEPSIIAKNFLEKHHYFKNKE
ncbi:osmoprotectant ABC transporter substrate-binding protein [Tuberibacillus sp. Marseille-P3662]|uniref:osmoprotectant ABC transporter substrate-binding protein n=1 Tax=Tuberibacillus sp. Marseille-P3662 TaxID=1965358 RepID=UPI000A1C8C80